MVYHIFKILSTFYYKKNITKDQISNLTVIKIAERHKNTYLLKPNDFVHKSAREVS